MTCQDCSNARVSQGCYKLHSLGCAHCGARLIAAIQALRARPREERAERMRAALADWMEHGHDEGTLRKMLKDGEFFAPID